MQVAFAQLADYATRTVDNKLVLVGLFDRLKTAKLPFQAGPMTLVLRVVLHPGEEGEHEVRLRLVDPDGKELFGLKTKVKIPEVDPVDGVSAEFILALNGVKFEKSGDHAFDVYLDGRYEETVRLKVMTGAPGKNG